MRERRKDKLAGALCAVLPVTLVGEASGAAEIIAYWNFNANDGDLYNWDANWGGGTLTLEPDWTNLSTAAGTDLNALFGDPAGDGLQLRSNANNGRHIDFRLSTTNYEGIVFSFDSRRTSPGFNGNQVWYSLDGDQYSLFSPYGLPSEYDTMIFDMSSVTELNDAAEVFLRIRLNGATNNGGRNHIDNVRVAGNLVPAPGALALFGLAAAVAGRRRRRRFRIYASPA